MTLLNYISDLWYEYVTFPRQRKEWDEAAVSWNLFNVYYYDEEEDILVWAEQNPSNGVIAVQFEL